MNATPQRIAVAMLGARRAYAVPRALAATGRLDRLFTDRPAAAREAGLPPDRITAFPLFGFLRAARRRLLRSRAAVLRDYLCANRDFCGRVLRHGLGDADAVYAFNTAALELFSDTPRRLRILDQITAPWSIEEPLLAAERERWPDWEPGSVAETDWRPLAAREAEEWALADTIICGSQHVATCIGKAGGPSSKCRVVPQGLGAARLAPSSRSNEGPLRVLFVGSLELRKGLPYLLDAARSLPENEVVFRAAGRSRLTRAALARLAARIELRGPLPHSRLTGEYAWADVLVLPSLSEGSANVCYEAMACGLPVVTTAESGSIVRDELDGFIIPARSAGSIAARLGELSADRARLRTMGERAAEHMRAFMIDHYGQRLLAALQRD